MFSFLEITHRDFTTQLFRRRKSNRSVLATLKVLLPLTPMVKSPFCRRQNPRSERLAVILLHYLLRCKTCLFGRRQLSSVWVWQS